MSLGTFVPCSSDPKRGRFSYMGGRGGLLWQRITYQTSTGSVLVGQRSLGGNERTHGVVTTENAAGDVSIETVSSFFSWLERQLEQLTSHQLISAAKELPFDFCGGFVGYLGYELKAECGFPSSHVADTPDAAMFLADRCACDALSLLGHHLLRCITAVHSHRTTVCAMQGSCC